MFTVIIVITIVTNCRGVANNGAKCKIKTKQTTSLMAMICLDLDLVMVRGDLFVCYCSSAG